MNKMHIRFSVETNVQTYSTELEVTPDEHALLIHLKYKLNQAYLDSELFDNFHVNMDVLK